jgi:hypothetical protein
MSVGSTRVSRADSPEAPSVSPPVRPRGAAQWIVAALTLAVSGCTTFSSSFAVIETSSQPSSLSSAAS